VLLFAYGSNLAAEEMAKFAPDARFVGRARLPGFRLELRRRSRRWGGGAADVVESEGDEVWGVLYEVPDGAALDAKEGAGFAYRRREVEVERDGRPTPAVVYEVIDKEPEEVAPTAEYAALVLGAARQHGLPFAWLRELEARLRAS
jgi:cation transport regulator ChaC